MSLLYETILKAIEDAKTLLHEVYPILTDQALPIDVNEIAKIKNIDISEMGFVDDKISGLVKRKSITNKPIIIVNKDNPDVRKRFSIAHEMGHLFLHSSNPVHIDTNTTYFRNVVSSEATDLKEIQANAFAAELLMPQELLLKDVESYNFEDGTNFSEIIKKLAKKYEVSEQAMTIRLGKLIH